jgi:hypothetical protein
MEWAELGGEFQNPDDFSGLPHFVEEMGGENLRSH